MIEKRTTLPNGLPRIDYFNEKHGWLASIYEEYAGWWSVKLSHVELLSCYHSEDEAYSALSFWLDIPEIYIKE